MGASSHLHFKKHCTRWVLWGSYFSLIELFFTCLSCVCITLFVQLMNSIRLLCVCVCSPFGALLFLLFFTFLIIFNGYWKTETFISFYFYLPIKNQINSFFSLNFMMLIKFFRVLFSLLLQKLLEIKTKLKKLQMKIFQLKPTKKVTIWWT